ncbi:SUKH-4 family immunity protein [Streptomyces fructofermentans]|uniref:SUKH-4 family immunity protein n=1 Tax=Streptomyces fructofermentans TaxID=152141 RepID=UPI0033FB7A03
MITTDTGGGTLTRTEHAPWARVGSAATRHARAGSRAAPGSAPTPFEAPRAHGPRRLSALLALFEAVTGGASPFRGAPEPIRPPAPTAAPTAAQSTEGELTLRVPARLLDREFGRGRVARFEDVDFPAVLTHEPTRRFLRESGLPEDAFPFRLDTDVPLPTLAEFHADEQPGTPGSGELPADADHLIRLGHLAPATGLVVDGATGAVLAWSEPEAALHALGGDVSVLAATLWLLKRQRAIHASLPVRPPRPRIGR